MVVKLLCLIASLTAVSAFQVQHGSIRALHQKKMSVEMKRSAWHPSRSSRAGSYLPTDHVVMDNFIEYLRERALSVGAEDYIQPIKDLQSLVEQDPNLQSQFALAFATAAVLKKGVTPLGTPAVKTFDEFLSLLNGLMQVAPAYYLEPGSFDDPADEPAGLIAFPINALLAWPMATYAGYGLFANALVNACFLRILNHWQENFLKKKASRYVLPAAATAPPLPPHSVGWLHDGAKKQMVAVAFNFAGPDTDVTFEEKVHRHASNDHASITSPRPAARPLPSPRGPFSAPRVPFCASRLCAHRNKARRPSDRPSSRYSNSQTHRTRSTTALPTGTTSFFGDSRSWATRRVLARVH